MTSTARLAFDRALSCEREGDVEAALEAYSEASELAPDDMEISYRTATALLRAGFLEEAVSHLRRIVFAEPDHTRARANLGNCQLLMGDLANAEPNFEEVLRLSPDNHNALFGLATVRLQQGKLDHARIPAQRLLELLPENAPALTLYAQTGTRDPQAAAAIAAFRKALHLDPAYVPALIGLADLLIRRKRFEESIALAREATLLQPSNDDARRTLGEAHQAAGDLTSARDAFEVALALSPGDTGLLVRLSVTSRKLEDLPSALLYAWQAFEAEPESTSAGNALGAVLAALSHPKDAKAVLTAVARGYQLPVNVSERIASLCASVESIQRGDASEEETETVL